MEVNEKTRNMKKSSKQDMIRNVCILAHVDHGKTTIADALVASNGHISDQSAGTIRFLDNRVDEMVRGITMKSSVITLAHKGPNGENMILNLIDTPGHVDFSSEVGAAVRLCDGALIVIDVLEGVCVQTKEAMKQAFEEHVKMILIINKMDRAIIDLEYSLDTIFIAITRIIEDCNAFVAGLRQYDLERSDDESDILFAPFLGNVIFASGIDGWGVVTKQVAGLIWKKLDQPSIDACNEKLWDFDYYASSGTVKPGALLKDKPNLFVTSFLKTIFHIYNTLYVRKNFSLYSSIVKILKIEKETPDMKHLDPRRKVRGVFQAWSGLADIIFKQTSELVPPPTKLSIDRSKYLINYRELNNMYGTKMLDYLCESSPDNPAIVYVSKMFAVDKHTLQKRNKVITGTLDREILKKELEDRKMLDEVVELKEKVEDRSDKFAIIALARIFSGTIKVGQELYVLHPLYEPPKIGIDLSDFLDQSPLIEKVIVSNLYILLGRNLEPTNSVSVGNICGIAGLERHIRRTGTISSTPFATPLIQQNNLEPIVWNTIACVNRNEQPMLNDGLKFLNQIDSSVQINYLKTGELALVTAGEVHLSKCLADIQSIAPINLTVSSNPMVSLKETIVTTRNKTNFNKIKSTTFAVNELDLNISIVAVPLPKQIIDVIKTYFDLLKCIDAHEHQSGISLMQQSLADVEMQSSYEKVYRNEKIMYRIKEQLERGFNTYPWQDMWKRIWSISSNRDNINILFNNTDDFDRNIFNTLNHVDLRSRIEGCVVNGFQMCCQNGPICGEPIVNCAFVVNKFQVGNFDALNEQMSWIQLITNKIPSMMRDFFLHSLKTEQHRIMEPIFTTDIEVTFNILGKVYSVINRRQGKVLDAVAMDQKERVFLVKAQIPVAESEGFANEMRTATSGQANPQLQFSHYELIDGDPWYEEEAGEYDDEETDEAILASKRASKFRKSICLRKGLKTNDKVVIFAEKQRTLNKKK